MKRRKPHQSRRKRKVVVTKADGSVETKPLSAFRKRRKKKWYSGVYLKSKHWQRVRAAVLERDKHRCRECGSTRRLEVHHLTYERLHRELLEDLITLCEVCHEGLHKGERLGHLRALGSAPNQT